MRFVADPETFEWLLTLADSDDVLEWDTATKPKGRSMKAQKTLKQTTKREGARKNSTIAEFGRRDLSDDIRASGVAVVGHAQRRATPSKATSILLDPALVNKLRKKGKRRGLGYQTMLKLIVYEHIDEY